MSKLPCNVYVLGISTNAGEKLKVCNDQELLQPESKRHTRKQNINKTMQTEHTVTNHLSGTQSMQNSVPERPSRIMLQGRFVSNMTDTLTFYHIHLEHLYANSNLKTNMCVRKPTILCSDQVRHKQANRPVHSQERARTLELGFKKTYCTIYGTKTKALISRAITEFSCSGSNS